MRTVSPPGARLLPDGTPLHNRLLAALPAADFARIRKHLHMHAGMTGRTLQEHGAYIGDNSGSTTQLKVGPPTDYVGTNLTTDAFKGKLTWDDFEVVEGGWQ